jgi:hypothetical protein
MVCLLRWLFARADKRHPHGGQLEKKPAVTMASTTRAGERDVRAVQRPAAARNMSWQPVSLPAMRSYDRLQFLRAGGALKFEFAQRVIQSGDQFMCLVTRQQHVMQPTVQSQLRRVA